MDKEKISVEQLCDFLNRKRPMSISEMLVAPPPQTPVYKKTSKWSKLKRFIARYF